jgi:indole-3-glycerol phosphate synthase
LEHWTPPQGTLGELTRAAYGRVHETETALPELRAEARDQAPARSFRAALRGAHVAVIAEVKRSSPSKGPINPGLEASEIARQYVEGGAAAISVLTEPTRFGGSLRDLEEVSRAVEVPTLRKDFIVHPVQVWEARVAGASAVLLIVRALPPDALRSLSDVAVEAGVDVLFEVRDQRELDRALAVGAAIIGVNNRNLETLVIDPGTAPALIPFVPPDVTAIAESGIQQARDADAAVAAGADALLVGSSLSGSDDPARAVALLTAFRRRRR